MSITAQDAVTLERLLLSSPGGAAVRWPDASLINFTDRAVKTLVERIRFPESRLTGVTIANQQEYPTPELYKVLRVYMNGQLIVPTDKSTLEGAQTLQYDQTGVGTPIAGSGAPAGAGGMMQPQWVTQTPVAYPFVNNWGAPAPAAQGWFPGQRSRYYWQGGSIGIVPAPNGVFDLVIECIRTPTTLVNLTDPIVVPDNFLDAIAWKAVEYAKFADDSGSSADQRNFALAQFDSEMRKLRTWKRQYTGDNNAPNPLNNRSFYHRGQHRYSGSGSW